MRATVRSMRAKGFDGVAGTGAGAGCVAASVLTTGVLTTGGLTAGVLTAGVRRTLRAERGACLPSAGTLGVLRCSRFSEDRGVRRDSSATAGVRAAGDFDVLELLGAAGRGFGATFALATAGLDFGSFGVVRVAELLRFAEAAFAPATRDLVESTGCGVAVAGLPVGVVRCCCAALGGRPRRLPEAGCVVALGGRPRPLPDGCCGLLLAVLAAGVVTSFGTGPAAALSSRASVAACIGFALACMPAFAPPFWPRTSARGSLVSSCCAWLRTVMINKASFTQALHLGQHASRRTR